MRTSGIAAMVVGSACACTVLSGAGDLTTAEPGADPVEDAAPAESAVTQPPDEASLAPDCGDIGALQPGSPWPMRGRCPDRTSRTSIVGPQSARLKWRTSPARPPLGRGPVIAADGTIYVGDRNGILYAIAPDGTQKWQFDLGDLTNDSSSASPAIGADGTIYVGSITGRFFALEPNGTEKWSTDPNAGDIDPSALIDSSGGIFFGGGSAFTSLSPDGGTRWRLATGGHDSSPALGPNGAIYVGGADGSLYSFSSSGALRWKVPIQDGGSAVHSTPAADLGGTVYFTADERTYAVTPAGEIRWSVATPGAEASDPALGQGVVFVGCSNACAGRPGLYALATDNGATQWTFPSGSTQAPAVGGDGTIYFASADGYVRAVSPAGMLKWEYQLMGPGIETAIGADGTLYATSTDGTLYAFER